MHNGYIGINCVEFAYHVLCDLVMLICTHVDILA